MDIYRTTMSCGADPEFFLKNEKNEIVSAKEVLKDKENLFGEGGKDAIKSNWANLIPDGILAEINIDDTKCRANLGNGFSEAFNGIKNILEEKKLKICFDGVVLIKKPIFDKMNSESKEFGCVPSYNVYTKGISNIPVNSETYRYRSAGGHLHLGLNISDFKNWELYKDQIVMMLDYIVGNTFVLLDQNKKQKKRREVYGRAGEYRLKPYGIEYRTLSNYWLRDYKLMSLAFNLANLAVSLVENGVDRRLFEEVSVEHVKTAINNNNVELAKKNMIAIFKHINCKHVLHNIMWWFLNKINCEKTIEQLSKPNHVEKRLGIYKLSDTQIMDKWINMPEGHGTGWESFFDNELERL